MLFNSYEFILVFLPVSLAGFFTIGKFIGREAAILWLFLASLFFYAWWNPAYLVLLMGSIAFNFVLGRYLFRLGNTGRQKAASSALGLGIFVNLALLGYYKYTDFFIRNVNAIFGTDIFLVKIVLPLAISFFTFNQIAYLVDARKGIAGEGRFSHYALFVTFFPHLIAGPIVHHAELMPQFRRRDALVSSKDDFAVGIAIFAIGLIKKAVLADGIAVYATPVFTAAAHGGHLTLFTAWGGALAYTMQLYFDFSGYSDMAIGAARLFGIHLPLNFNSPYKSTSITEFWRRWHITLSRFLRDYLYIPLGGNRKGKLRRYLNLFITMLLGGLWHGAGWTFMLWGGLHGVYLIINHGWRFIYTQLGYESRRFEPLTKALSWLITFVAVVIGWVFFRAESLPASIAMLEGMFGFNGIAIPNALMTRLGPVGGWLHVLGVRSSLADGAVSGGSDFILTWLWVGFLFAIAMVMPNTQEIMARHHPALDTYKSKPRDAVLLSDALFGRLRWAYSRRWAVVTAAISAAGLLSLSHVSEFLYFQF